jgi:hypothetical protein
MMQSRRSLLIWKVFGQRLDGWNNDDFPYEAKPGDPNSLQHKGEPVADTPQNRERAHVAYLGSVMPPPDAVKSGKVQPLSEEDKLTLVRWIDLGCPIDLEFDPEKPAERSGWLVDDNRPTLTVTYPQAGANAELSRVVVGMHDYGTGLNPESFSVTADVPLGDFAGGENLAAKFKPASAGVWELKLATPIRSLEQGRLTVSVTDRQGNITRIQRTFSVGGAVPARGP